MKEQSLIPRYIMALVMLKYIYLHRKSAVLALYKYNMTP